VIVTTFCINAQHQETSTLVGLRLTCTAFQTARDVPASLQDQVSVHIITAR